VKMNHKIIVAIFFTAYLFIGVCAVGDYGISWDDPITRIAGVVTYEYVFRGEEALFSFSDRFHGTAFELPLYAVEKAFNLTRDPRLVYLARHFITFLLFFLGVIFFYKLCRDRFRSWKMGLLGSLFLVLSPRIFAHSFYNSKDIAFLAVFIISVYTLIRFLRKKSFSAAVCHALACAYLIDIRVAGIMVPVLTVLFLVLDAAVAGKGDLKARDTVLSFLVYAVCLTGFTVLFWPFLWRDPVRNFLGTISHMSRYPWPGTVLYLGQYLKATELPWHYVPVWMGITTPVVYIACFIAGCFATGRSFFRTPRQYYTGNKLDLICVLWFFVPIVMVIVLRSVLYDGWRQMFFIYPAFLMIALAGLKAVFEYAGTGIRGLGGRIARAAVILAVASGLAVTAVSMIQYHPYQNVYFNGLMDLDKESAFKDLDLDYWGLSYRKGLEYILKNDKDEAIKICVANPPGVYNADILHSDERKRLQYMERASGAKYFLTNHRWHREEYPYEEYYTIKPGGVKIMTVYKTE